MSARPIVEAFVALGSNLGDSRQIIAAAANAIASLPDTGALRRSPLYRSAPLDADGPDYLNAVAAIETGLDPIGLLDALQAIEAHFGRRRPYRNAPRTLDLDLLLFGQARIMHPRLTVPHPRMHQRAFVLRPLADLAPQLQLPGLGPIGPLLARCADQSITRETP